MITFQNRHKEGVQLLGSFCLICHENEGLFSKMKYNCNNPIIYLQLFNVILVLRVGNRSVIKLDNQFC